MKNFKIKAAVFCAAAFMLLLSLCGCSEEMLESFLEAASDAAAVMRPSVSISQGDMYYDYRYDFHHDNWAGDLYLDLGSAGFALSDILGHDKFTVPVYEMDDKGRPVSVTAFIDVFDPDSGISDEMLPDPPGWNISCYPGIAQDGFLFRRVMLLPECLGGNYNPENLFTGTSFLYYGSYLDIISEIEKWFASGRNVGLLYYARLFYHDRNLIPDGMAVRIYGIDGSFELHRYLFDLQPGIEIDYASGRNWIEKAGDPNVVQPDSEIT